jgi:hypothetical protein
MNLCVCVCVRELCINYHNRCRSNAVAVFSALWFASLTVKALSPTCS